jgi:hypothetical protein
VRARLPAPFVSSILRSSALESREIGAMDLWREKGALNGEEFMHTGCCDSDESIDRYSVDLT